MRKDLRALSKSPFSSAGCSIFLAGVRLPLMCRGFPKLEALRGAGVGAGDYFGHVAGALRILKRFFEQ